MLLSDEQIAGKVPVTVINNKIDGTEFTESTNAFIEKIHQGDRQGVHALVNIDGDLVDRWIFAKYQDENLITPLKLSEAFKIPISKFKCYSCKLQLEVEHYSASNKIAYCFCDRCDIKVNVSLEKSEVSQ